MTVLEKGKFPLLAGWVKSPTAASEYLSSQNLGLADRLLSGNRYGRFGSGCELALSEFMAEKPPLEFRFPEPVLGHRVQATQTGSTSAKSAAQACH